MALQAAQQRDCALIFGVPILRRRLLGRGCRAGRYSTVTDLARLRGWSMLQPLAIATW
jgi:hypothetical protein